MHSTFATWTPVATALVETLGGLVPDQPCGIRWQRLSPHEVCYTVSIGMDSTLRAWQFTVIEGHMPLDLLAAQAAAGLAEMLGRRAREAAEGDERG